MFNIKVKGFKSVFKINFKDKCFMFKKFFIIFKSLLMSVSIFIKVKSIVFICKVKFSFVFVLLVIVFMVLICFFIEIFVWLEMVLFCG